MAISINARNVCVLVLSMAFFAESGMAVWFPTTPLFEDPPVAYDEQWGRLVDAFRMCEEYKGDPKWRKEIAGAPKYGEKHGPACKALNDTLEGRDKDKKEVVNRSIDAVYYAVQLARHETEVLRQQKEQSDHELRFRRKLKDFEKKAMQAGLEHLVKAETLEDKRRMFELEQQAAKRSFVWEQEKAKNKFEEELKKQQEAAEQNKQ